MRLIVKYVDGRISELVGVYSAVAYHDERDTATGGAPIACGEQSLFASLLQENNNSGIAERERKKGVEGGIGRIGGMGERKDKGETEGKREGEPTVYSMTFSCSDGSITAPRDVIDRAIQRWGEQTVTDELMKARLWLEAKPGRKRKKRGIGMFIQNWLERGAQYRAERKRQNSGTLLNDETTDQNW